jgi:1-acyl-sn-glycerol-3-phosphate acyltransferase
MPDIEKKPIIQQSNKHAWKAEFEQRYCQPGQKDEFGWNLDTLKKAEFFSRFLYEDWFKAITLGIENIPAKGPVVLVGNHSGVLPIDAFLFATAVMNYHPSPRRVRFLVHDSLLTKKSTGSFFKGIGGVPAKYDAALKLLNNDELTFFYPEGPRGTGKKFSERYRLRHFDSGFVKAAIETRACIVPVTTIGGDEIYPLLADIKPIAKLMRLPYWPITPTHPLLPFTASCIPLPVRMLIKIGEPICFNYPLEAADEHEVRHELCNKVQFEMQRQINRLLKIRKSPFSAWDLDGLVLD